MNQGHSCYACRWECTDGVLEAALTSAVVKVSAAALSDKVLANLQGACHTVRRGTSVFTAGTCYLRSQCFCSLKRLAASQAGDEQPITAAWLWLVKSLKAIQY